MSTILPTLCRACRRAAGPPPGFEGGPGTWAPNRCAAYPDGIPIDIALFGDDHHTARGDEVGGMVFVQAAGEAAADAFADWRRFNAAPGRGR